MSQLDRFSAFGPFMPRLIILIVVLFSSSFCPAGKSVCADDIGFVERFALAEDREKILKELVPGTENYYYFHCLHYQNIEKFDAVDEMAKVWVAKFGYSQLARQILNRQALLTYDSNPKKSIAYLTQQLNLNLNHQRANLQGPSLPSTLDQNLISRKTLTARALAQFSNTQGFETRALDWLLDQKLEIKDLRHLLQRLSQPDHPRLVELIVRELNDRYSGGFGTMTIHRNLTKRQLGELEKKLPKILNQQNFVNIVLGKIRPNPDVNYETSVAAQKQLLDEQWAFVKKLAPVHNSLKASVLYHRLVFQRKQGNYDRGLFLDYIKLPRNMFYVNSDYLKRDENKRFALNLSANYQTHTLLPPIGNDSALISDYLQNFFKDDQDFKAFETYLNSKFLTRQFAEAKIVNGLGNADKWASMISPSEYQEIKDRVDLDFTFTNRSKFNPSDTIAVELDVKNVSKLIVKVFEINTQNYYRDRLSEVDTNIELDGLLPNKELVFEYTETPFVKKQRRFEFPELKNRGVYVIDFIGNRKSCRALVRKGGFRLLEKVTAAGHEIKVIDEQNKIVDNSSIWMQGKKFESDKAGMISIPFSSRPVTTKVVISDGKTCSLGQFVHQSESYNLDAGIYIDRESLIAGEKAKVVFRSSLYVNGISTRLGLLKNTRLVLTSTDIDGTVSTKEVKDFELFEDKEASFEFKVPPRLQAIQAQIFGEIQNLSQAKKQTLSASEVFYVNKIEKETKVEDLYFSQVKNGFAIDLLGKNGELKPGRPIALQVKHRDFTKVVTVTLQTNMRGRIHLGELVGIDSISATGPEGTKRSFKIPHSKNTHRTIVAKVGDTVKIPISKFSGVLTRKDISLFETVGTNIVSDHFEKLKLITGVVSIKDLLAGNYQLYLKAEQKRIEIFVVDGDSVDGLIVGGIRKSEINNPTPLQISKIETKENKTTIKLSGVSDTTRVHLFGTNFQPRFDAFGKLTGTIWNRGPDQLPQTKSLYANGRKIGDEYQYILDRKYAEKFPGVMLKRPGLLLQPWAVRSTETSTQDLQKGSKFSGRDQSSPGADGSREAKRQQQYQDLDESTLDFLANGSVVILNVLPKDGEIVLDHELFESHPQLHIVAISDDSTAYRFAHLIDTTVEPDDRSFAAGLDPDQRFARKKEISFVDAESDFVLNDTGTGKFELYDNLPSIYRLFTSLNADSKLTEFRFILDWRNKSDKEKLELYSKFACHELNFFLFKKDRTFFEAVVGPYLQNKKDKTFLDRYLIKDDLSEFVKPWQYSQLNIVERILLANSIADEKIATMRHVSDWYNISPTSRERFDQLFRFAVATSSLDADDDGLLKQLGDIGREYKTENANKLAKIRLSDRSFASGGEAAEEFQSDSVQLGVPAAQARGAKAKASPPKSGGSAVYSINGRPNAAGESKALALKSLDFAGKSPSKNFYKRLESTKELEERRKSIEQLFRQVEKTKEWAENNYYNLPIQQQVASLVSVNQFWKDFANHDPTEPFYSSNIPEASRNFTEMMFAISVLDLNWESEKHQYETEDRKLRLTAKSPLLIFHEQIRPAVDGRKGTSILVSQNFFKVGDRYRFEGPDRLDKFVTDEFIKQTPYGCQIVVTNPTSSKQKIDVLVQVPVGCLPLAGHLETKSIHLELDPYRTSSLEYFFYFPEPGTYEHYPVNVAKNETVIAFAEPVKFNVVNQPSKIDKTSWEYISQNGTNTDVLDYLESNNLLQVDLNKIAWRMGDAKFFQDVIGKLSGYHVFNPTLWAYGFKHNLATRMNDFLVHRNDFVSATGPFIESKLLTNDRVARRTYEHLEYEPLINARIHKLGVNRKILNNRFSAQYHRLLWILACKKELSNDDVLSLTYYMLLQDRIAEAIDYFKQASSGSLQYDYMAAYLDMFNSEPKIAREIASRYSNYKVDRWRKAFQSILSQLDEIQGKSTDLVDDSNRTEVQSKLAAKSPTFDFKVDAKQIDLAFENVDRVLVNYYVMDVELLFSRNPFVQQFSGELTYIRPRKSEWIDLPNGNKTHQWKLPAELDRSNVLVEVSSGDQTKSQAYYAHALTVQTIERFGQLKVNNQKTGRSIPKTYCKVYARLKNGGVQFYKDGYTDLRGRFDYTSLSTNALDNVARFSILVMSDEHGATVKEVLPPKR